MSFSLIRRFASAITYILGALPHAAHAQCYSKKPIRLVIDAGGSSDITARVISEEMGRKFGLLKIVDNHLSSGGYTRISTDSRLPIDYWLALAGPTKSPPPITNSLRSALTDALQNLVVRGRFTTLVTSATSDRKCENLRKTKANLARWIKISRSRNISVN